MKNRRSKISLIVAGLLVMSLFLGGCYSSHAVSVVQTTTASVAMIDGRRRARIERRNIPSEIPRYVDSDYGDQ